MRLLCASLAFVIVAGCGDDGAPGTSDLGADVAGDTSSDSTHGVTNRPPVLASVGDRVAELDTIQIRLSASDPDGDPLQYFLAGAPAGSEIDTESGAFRWTPSAEGTFYVTFGVTDGVAEDRETISIEVLGAKPDNVAPVFMGDLGPQSLTTGQAFSLQLQASDANGDRLTFGVSGASPEGSTLDASTGLFRWTPGAAWANSTVSVRFSVADADLASYVDVELLVDQGNRAPTFADVPLQFVVAGDTASVDIAVTDPDGDTVQLQLRDSVVGAELTGNKLTFTPHSSLAGRVVDVAVVAFDGTLSATKTVSFQVDAAPSCQNDSYEPNTIGSPSALNELEGIVRANLCDLAGDTDVDAFSFAVPAASTVLVSVIPADGETVSSMMISLEDEAGQNVDLDSNNVIGASDGAGTWTGSVSRLGGGRATLSYVLAYTILPGDVCDDDAGEPNDSTLTAHENLPASATACLGDPDFWLLPNASCGQTLSIDGTIDGEVSYIVWGSDGTFMDAAVGTASAAWQSRPLPPGGHRLEVRSNQVDVSGVDYALTATLSGGCEDDSIGATSREVPHMLSTSSGSVRELTLCCAADWFSINLEAGEELEVSVEDLGRVSLAVFAEGGSAALETASGSIIDPAALMFAAPSDGVYLIRAVAPLEQTLAGSAYDLSWSVTPKTTGACSFDSCAADEYCDLTTGDCRDAACTSSCAGGYECIEGMCLAGTSDAALCQRRTGFDLKRINGRYFCAPMGGVASYAACSSPFDCAGALSCVPTGSSGYCSYDYCGSAALGYTQCPSGAKCVKYPGQVTVGYCAQFCFTSSECASGFTCSGQACVKQ